MLLSYLNNRMCLMWPRELNAMELRDPLHRCIEAYIKFPLFAFVPCRIKRVIPTLKLLKWLYTPSLIESSTISEKVIIIIYFWTARHRMSALLHCKVHPQYKCTGSFNLSHLTCVYWIFWLTICDVTAHAGRLSCLTQIFREHREPLISK